MNKFNENKIARYTKNMKCFIIRYKTFEKNTFSYFLSLIRNMKFKSCADSTQAEWQAEVEVTSVLNEAGGTKNALMYPQPLHLDENEETALRALGKI